MLVKCNLLFDFVNSEKNLRDKVRCQSCGMPLSEDFGNYGTMDDGTFHTEFCIFCFQNGSFTNPTQTMEEMIQSSIENMIEDLQMSHERAKELAWAFIPKLKRWQ